MAIKTTSVFSCDWCGAKSEVRGGNHPYAGIVEYSQNGPINFKDEICRVCQDAFLELKGKREHLQNVGG